MPFPETIWDLQVNRWTLPPTSHPSHNRTRRHRGQRRNGLCRQEVASRWISGPVSSSFPTPLSRELATQFHLHR